MDARQQSALAPLLTDQLSAELTTHGDAGLLQGQQCLLDFAFFTAENTGEHCRSRRSSKLEPTAYQRVDGRFAAQPLRHDIGGRHRIHA